LIEISEWQFSECDLEDLRRAKLRLERPALPVKVAEMRSGSPSRPGLKRLPRGWNKRVGRH